MKSTYNRLVLSSPNYPRLLKEIYDPPPLLYVRGQWTSWEERSWVAVVGARKASKWGLQKTREIVSQFVEAGFGIVSGLAYGIDGEAHKTCLERGGVTWGVLGSGIDRIYPVRHLDLAKKMEEKGGLLSEFPLGTPPKGAHFPQRNRIISGLSQAVVIVEAAMKSGSLITARFALEQGREVFVAVPPNDDVCYEGNYRLLEEGATPMGGEYRCHPRESGDPVDPLDSCSLLTTRRDKFRRNDSGGGNDRLLDCLTTPRSLDYLISKLSQKPQEILSQLLILESRGLIKKIPGALWRSL